MRVRTAGIPLVIAVLLLAPLASAEVTGEATMDFESPAAADMTVELTITGQDAQDARAAIDSDAGFGGSGNGDGQVTQDEVDAFEELLKSFFNDPEATVGGEMTMDGQNASGSNLTAFDILDATGDVNSTEPMQYHMVMRIEWSVTPGDEHTFVSAGDDGDGDGGDGMGDVTLTIRAPDGYRISSTDGLPDGADVSDDEITYQGTDDGTTGPITIVFSQGGGAFGGAPALGGAIVLLVVIALGLASRHRP